MDNSKQDQVIEGKVMSFTFDTIETEVTNKTDSKNRHTHGRRKIKGFANTATIDRGKDLVIPDAFKSSIDKFMENPVMFFNHDWDVPVGTITDFNISDKGLFVEAEVAKDFEEADKVWKLIDQGLVKSFSIGFRTLKSDWDPETNITIIKDLELLEVSIVTIPMNADSTFIRSGKNFKSIMFNTGEGESPVTYKQMLDKDVTDESDLATKLTQAILIESNCDTTTGNGMFGNTSEFKISIDNSPKIQEFSFVEGDCSICDETDIKGLSWAVTPAGQEHLMCMSCFVKQDEDWSEEFLEAKQAVEYAEKLEDKFVVYKQEAEKLIESISKERNTLLDHVKRNVTHLAGKVVKIVS